jgi:hypothetical protein
LTQEASIQSAQVETITADKPKGGELARWAGIICADIRFVMWVKESHGEDLQNSTEAAIWLRDFCGVESRAELDHNKEAAQIFREEIMKPFDEWKAKNA